MFGTCSVTTKGPWHLVGNFELQEASNTSTLSAVENCRRLPRHIPYAVPLSYSQLPGKLFPGVFWHQKFGAFLICASVTTHTRYTLSITMIKRGQVSAVSWGIVQPLTWSMDEYRVSSRDNTSGTSPMERITGNSGGSQETPTDDASHIEDTTSPCQW